MTSLEDRPSPVPRRPLLLHSAENKGLSLLWQAGTQLALMGGATGRGDP
jgi:hypothetical protein